MGTNWAAGLLRWKPHTDKEGVAYLLNHLHPFPMTLELAAKDGHPARTVQLHIAFSLHTFTRSIEETDDPADQYRDNREVRTFCRDRYRLSTELPTIASELPRRSCQFATSKSGRINYVTIDVNQGVRYGVFFDLMRRKEAGPDGILLMVQSAYALESGKPDPGKGKISFSALLGATLRGKTPKPPPR
jgi:hypothetical protein